MTITSTITPSTPTSGASLLNEAPAYISRTAAVTKAMKDELAKAQDQRNALRQYVIHLRTAGNGYRTREAGDSWESANARLMEDTRKVLETTAISVNLDRVDEVVEQLTAFNPQVRTAAEASACRKASTRLLRTSGELHSLCEEHRILTGFAQKVAEQGASFGIARPRHTEGDWGPADNNLRNAAKKELRDSFDV